MGKKTKGKVKRGGYMVSILSLIVLTQCAHPWSNQPSPSSVPTFPPDAAERCILDSKQCSPPCWEGIIPGVTGKEEALSLLAQSELCLQDTIKEQIVDRNRQSIRWLDKSAIWHKEDYLLTHIVSGHDIIVRDNTVDSIGLLVNTRSCQLTAEAVVNQYGEPELVLFTPARGPYEVPVELDLFYPTLGLAFAVQSTNPPRKESLVGVVNYSVPTSLDAFLQDASWADWLENRVQWQGFAPE